MYTYYYRYVYVSTTETAHELGRLLRGMICHVNVIPLNPTGGFDGRPTPKVDYSYTILFS